MSDTRKCFSCKEIFPLRELHQYASVGSTTMHYYCTHCYKEKLMREQFANTVCRIFGLKSPGPRIWAERKRLKEKLGYTDSTIIECLDFLYTIEGKKKLAESICLVNANTIDRMIKYKQERIVENNYIDSKVATNLINHIVPIKEEFKPKQEILNADDFLDE